MAKSLAELSAEFFYRETMLIALLEDYSRRSQDENLALLMSAYAEGLDKIARFHFKNNQFGLMVNEDAMGVPFNYEDYKKYVLGCHQAEARGQGMADKNIRLDIFATQMFQKGLLALQAAARENNEFWINTLGDEVRVVCKIGLSLSAYYFRLQFPNGLTFLPDEIEGIRKAEFINADFDGVNTQFGLHGLTALRTPNEEGTIPAYQRVTMGGRSGQLVPCGDNPEAEYFEKIIVSFLNSLK